MKFSNPLLLDTFFYFLSKIFPGLANLLFLLIVNRSISIIEYGNYSLAFYYFALIASLSFGWLNQSELRYGLSHGSKKILKPSFPEFLAPCIILILVYIIFFQLINSDYSISFSFFCIFSIGIFGYMKTLLQSNFYSKQVFYINIIQSMFFLFLPILFYKFGKIDSKILIFLTSISGLLSCMFFLNHLSLKITGFRSNSIKTLKKWFIYGAPVSLWSSLVLLLPFLDRYFISIYLDDVQLGQYSGMNELSLRIFSLIIFPYTMALHPRLTNLWNSNKRIVVTKLISKTLKIGLVLLIVIFFLINQFDKFFFSVCKFIIPSLKNDSKDLQ